MSTEFFYQSLKPLKQSLADMLRDENFADLPADWHVVVADIKNSSAAVQNGAHNDVNLVAVGSLIAGLNIAKKAGIEIPFFFGGDGGVLLVPQNILHAVLKALNVHNINTQKNFGLSLHIGSVPMYAILEAGHTIRIAKNRLGKKLSKAVLVGDGLLWAERQVKSLLGDKYTDETTDETMLDMTGLECRWDRIKPPQKTAEVVCYIIEAKDPAEQLPVYNKVLHKTDEIFGTTEVRNPLSIDRMRLLLSARNIRKEMLAKFGKMRKQYLTTEFLKTVIGRILFRYKLNLADMRATEYLNQVIANADTLTVDGRINTIISGTADKHQQFQDYLNILEQQGELVFGYHRNQESIMTCYIEARDEKHIHFVDGSEGGYTAAATILKQKLSMAA